MCNKDEKEKLIFSVYFTMLLYAVTELRESEKQYKYYGKLENRRSGHDT